jgi:hypothetical protein
MTTTTQQTAFVAHDLCGWHLQYGRFTHMPSGDTLVQEDWMGQADWDKAQLAFFRKHPGLNVHECPGAYNTNGKLMGTTDEICARLRQRLGVAN